MTPAERDLVMNLVTVPGRPPPMANDDFLRAFGATDGVALSLVLLADAVDRRDQVDVDMAMVVCSRFGHTAEHLPVLEHLAMADWHQKHEDVASALQRLRSPTSVPGLVHLSEWVPEYLAFDENRALAVKAIWGLGAINTIQAREALVGLAEAAHLAIRAAAVHQLER